MNHKDISPIVSKVLAKTDKIMEVVKKYPTPFYVFDSQEVDQSLTQFKKAFTKHIPKIKIYYAVKTNHYDSMIEYVLNHKMGLDVSSSRELNIGLKSNCSDMIFTGPGKTIESLKLALELTDKVTLLVDSFGELQKIGTLSSQLKKSIRVGVRIYTKQQKTWSKFGISITQLKDFWKEAQKYPFIELSGIQFHNSWNADAKPYVKTIKEIYEYLKNNFDTKALSQIKFIDIGGGFRPYKSEGHYKEEGDPSTYTLTESIPVEEYAREISTALKKTFDTILDCEYFTEPGRILSNSSMHVVVKVVDKKSDKVVITDGGINIVGWERFEYEYFPVINLTHMSLTENECNVYGNLCMPQDIWGYSYFGCQIEEEDVLVIPYQGALTYSLTQEFINPKPKVYNI